MAASWVAGTSFSQTTGTSIAASVPGGLSDGDILLAGVCFRATLTAASGWTLVGQTVLFFDGSITQRLAVYKKTTVTSGDSGSSHTWSQSSSDIISVAYAAVHSSSGVVGYADSTDDEMSDWTFTPTDYAATADGQMQVIFLSNTEGDSSTQSPAASTSYTLSTQASATNYRLACQYRAVNTGQGVSSAFDFNPGAGSTPPMGHGAVVVLLGASSSSVEGRIAVEGPLQSPDILGKQAFAARIEVDGPLGSPATLGWHDNTAGIDTSGPQRYVCDLIIAGQPLRVPISSWQATLQTGAAQYVQCVLPSPGDLVDDIAAATHFRITRVASLLAGGSTEFEIATCPLEQVQYARGGTNYSGTLSGYIDAPADSTWHSSRTLSGVRAIFNSGSGMRVSCSIDWLLRPGMTALIDASSFVASYVNYYVNSNDAWMDVGERAT